MEKRMNYDAFPCHLYTDIIEICMLLILLFGKVINIGIP